MMVPVVRVSVTDAAGHVATADNSTSVTVAIGVNPGTGALTGGTPVTVVNGVASYAGLSINRVGIGYTLTARGGSLTAATSGVFNISVGPAFKVAFTTQPSATATGGTAFAVQPVVTVQDFSGNRVTTDASSISLTASAGAGDVVSCTANPLNASSGIATFANCRINTASATPYLLTAAGGGLITAVSTGVTVSVGSATKLAFSTQPSAIAVRGVAFASQPVVKVQDAGGNTVTASSSSILLTPSGGTLTCSNSNSRTAVAGSATWAGCSFSTTGTRTLGASSAGLASATSASIVVGNPQVAAPTGVTSVAGTQNNRTTVVFTASSPATGVASYSCSVYKNTGRTSTPVRGLLILSAACRAGNNNSINLRTGGADTGTNTIVVVVRAVPAVNYLENFSTDIVGSVG
jgi:hypothetical protein